MKKIIFSVVNYPKRLYSRSHGNGLKDKKSESYIDLNVLKSFFNIQRSFQVIFIGEISDKDSPYFASHQQHKYSFCF
jgi:hypothetical protein